MCVCVGVLCGCVVCCVCVCCECVWVSCVGVSCCVSAAPSSAGRLLSRTPSLRRISLCRTSLHLPSARPPKMSRFFPLPPPFSLFFSLSLSGCLLVSFFLSLGVFSQNFGGVFEGRDTQIYPHPTPAHTHAHTTQHNTPTQHTHTTHNTRTPLKKKIGLSRTWLKRTWPKQNLA